jgi:hypothetical protein
MALALKDKSAPAPPGSSTERRSERQVKQRASPDWMFAAPVQPGTVKQEFDNLRWFDLPAVCLVLIGSARTLDGDGLP